MQHSDPHTEATGPTGSESEPETASDAPQNRAERRAQRRGKKPPAPNGYGPAPFNARHDQVVVPRRAGRRGNR
jgi:hypothetical protein